MTYQPIEIDELRSEAAERAIETHRRWKLANLHVVPAAAETAQDQAGREITDILDDVGDFPCEMPDAPWLPRSGGTQATLHVLSRLAQPFRA